MSETSTTDRPFEEFDVESSEEEFLLEALNRDDAPKQDILMFQRARRASDSHSPEPTRYQDATPPREGLTSTKGSAELLGNEGTNASKLLTIDKWTPIKSYAMLYEVAKSTYSKPDEYSKPTIYKGYEPNINRHVPYQILQTEVESFARRCVVERKVNGELTASQWRQFTGAIYYYARTTGMGKHQAKTEAMRAKAAYRRRLGLAGGYQLDESEEDSTVKLEVCDAVKYITSLKADLQDGPIDSAILIPGWDEVRARIENYVRVEKLFERTWDAKGTVANTGEGVEVSVEAIAGEQARLNNRERRKRRKLESMLKTKARDGDCPTVATAPAAKPSKARRRRSRKLSFAVSEQVDGNTKTGPGNGKADLLAEERKRAILDGGSKNQKRKPSILSDTVGDQPNSGVTPKVKPANGPKKVRKGNTDDINSITKKVEGHLNSRKPREQLQVRSQNLPYSSRRHIIPILSDTGLEKEQDKKEPEEWSATGGEGGHDNGYANDQRPEKKRKRRNKVSMSVNNFTSIPVAEPNIERNEGYVKTPNVVEPVKTRIYSNGRKRKRGEARPLKGKSPQSKKIRLGKKGAPILENVSHKQMVTVDSEGPKHNEIEASECTASDRRAGDKTPGLNKEDSKKVVEASGETKPLLDVASMNVKIKANLLDTITPLTTAELKGPHS
jgi:hypothetical protein